MTINMRRPQKQLNKPFNRNKNKISQQFSGIINKQPSLRHIFKIKIASYETLLFHDIIQIDTCVQCKLSNTIYQMSAEYLHMKPCGVGYWILTSVQIPLAVILTALIVLWKGSQQHQTQSPQVRKIALIETIILLAIQLKVSKNHIQSREC